MVGRLGKKFRCIRRLLTIVLVMIITMSLVGCKWPSKVGVIANVGNGADYSDIRLAIGPTVEKETEEKVDISSQTRLTVKIQSGSVKITRGAQDELQIIEKISLMGPASKERLNEWLKEIKSDVEITSMSVAINHKAYLKADVNADAPVDEKVGAMTDAKDEEELRPLYRCTVEMELVVPEAFTVIGVDAENAVITMSGFEGMSKVELSAERGLINANQCSFGKMSVLVDNGDIFMDDITGNGTYECGRGDIMLTGVKGDADVKSLAGDSIIENAEGKLNCDISAGSLMVRESKMESGSVLYASTGTISADLQGIGSEGSYTIKSSAGDIRVKLPKKDGWSMSAKSTRGRIRNHMDPVPETLETGPEGEVYGDVNGGGPFIDIYVDMGNIILD